MDKRVEGMSMAPQAPDAGSSVGPSKQSKFQITYNALIAHGYTQEQALKYLHRAVRPKQSLATENRQQGPQHKDQSDGDDDESEDGHSDSSDRSEE